MLFVGMEPDCIALPDFISPAVDFKPHASLENGRIFECIVPVRTGRVFCMGKDFNRIYFKIPVFFIWEIRIDGSILIEFAHRAKRTSLDCYYLRFRGA